MTPTPRTDEVRGHIAARYNVHGSMSIAYTEMGKWADKLEQVLVSLCLHYWWLTNCLYLYPHWPTSCSQ